MAQDEEKKLIVAPFNKEDIIEIAQQADEADSYEEVVALVNKGITDGDIEAGAKKHKVPFAALSNANFEKINVGDIVSFSFGPSSSFVVTEKQVGTGYISGIGGSYLWTLSKANEPSSAHISSVKLYKHEIIFSDFIGVIISKSISEITYNSNASAAKQTDFWVNFVSATFFITSIPDANAAKFIYNKVYQGNTKDYFGVHLADGTNVNISAFTDTVTEL